MVGSAVLRIGGQHLLQPGRGAATAVLLVATMPVAALVVRALCRRAGLPRDRWLSGAVALLLPTLLLDPFASAYFPTVFPNMEPEMAGAFGGWMLCWCAGGFVGTVPAWRPRR